MTALETTSAPHTAPPVALTTAIGWLILFATTSLLYAAVLIPETPMGSPGRAVVDKIHMSWGVVALMLVIARLILWWRQPPVAPPGAEGVVFGIARDLSLAFYLAVLVDALVGPVRAWGEGYAVPFFNFATLPSLMPAVYEIRVVAGYIHSAVSFFVTAIIPIGVAVAVGLGWRARVPFYRLFPC